MKCNTGKAFSLKLFFPPAVGKGSSGFRCSFQFLWVKGIPYPKRRPRLSQTSLTRSQNSSLLLPEKGKVNKQILKTSHTQKTTSNGSTDLNAKISNYISIRKIHNTMLCSLTMWKAIPSMKWNPEVIKEKSDKFYCIQIKIFCVAKIMTSEVKITNQTGKNYIS